MAYALSIALLGTACSGGGSATRIEHHLALPSIEAPIPLKKVVAPPPVRWSPSSPSFQYMLPFDFGIRADNGGSGYFLAPRKHGKHNGLDFLAPVGTPTSAICNGEAKFANKSGYGKTVQLVCKLPSDLGGDDGLYVSFLYAHLERASVGEHWVAVKAGAKLGVVGKTGNAAGPGISPHLHLEAIVRASEEEAKSERHSGVDPKAGDAADPFFEALRSSCLDPAHFSPHAGVRRERRADPYVLLMCAGKPKPDLTAPGDDALRHAASKWSEHYAALGFDVDRGPRPD